jgi:ATP-binding cassette subfamily B protein
MARTWLAVLALSAVLGALLQLALPYALGHAVDGLITGGLDSTSGQGRLALCAAVIAGVVLCDGLETWASGSAGAQTSAELRRRLIVHVLGVGPSLRFPPGELVTRIGLNAEEAGQAPQAVVTAASLLIPTAGGLIALTLIDPWLAVALFGALILIGLILKAFIRDSTAIAGGYQQAQGDIAARLLDALAGARTIAAAGTAHTEAARVLIPLPALRGHGLGLWRANARAGIQAGLVIPMLELLVLGAGGLRLSAGDLTVGELYSAVRYAVLGAGLSSALGYAGTIARARAALCRVGEVLAEEPRAVGVRDLPDGPGTLEVEGLVLPGGSVTAVVGKSGSGKSRFTELAGARLDGVRLDQLSPAGRRRAVGHAFDRPVLVGRTLADAICLGNDTADPQVAAQAASADGFIRLLPDGYATRLEDAPMSGGERQRIGLARAFAQGERLLILDDATSSLDTVTEQQVSAALTGELGGRTRLVVTHRAATAAAADKVIWLDEGRVRGYASHQVLWPDPDYRRVFHG